MEFKDKLKQVRLSRELSRKQLAKLTELSVRTIEGYEQGIREPKRSTLYKLADALEIDADELARYLTRYEYYIKLSGIQSVKELLKIRKETDEQVKKNLKTIEALINESLSCIYWSEGDGGYNNYLYSIEAYLGDAKEKINSTISYLEKEYDF